ncbi:hypothetical protein ACFFU1_03825 [Algibacter miyuki]|uniref:Uncharacterized protein n=1 Tax=Algibacter miyuki TaxID=1306933 RepID=A0ABV5GWK6_9FLAO|nr:hypothetical protein [Algibacter miyuki]MDN3664255.1 hypothetical protein [Algibacter miyuki]
MKHGILYLCFLFAFALNAQQSHDISIEKARDSVKKRAFVKALANGYFPTKYFNFDLRYLMKYNQYEAVRTGLGLETNTAFSDKYRINTYLVYGFRDTNFKYSLGAGVRVAEASNTWINASYTDDLSETGSTQFLTDKRIFQFFEPRLLNISLFHKHITKAISLEHEFTPKISTETEFSTSKIDPTYSYGFNLPDKVHTNFTTSSVKSAIQWSPFSRFESTKTGMKETKDGYPKFTFQYTKSFKNVFKSDFNFSKFDFRTLYKIGDTKKSFSEITLVSGVSGGDTPLTHLYHAYPNNINKETILQRFSVAGLNSFETMFFNEFFSDKFATFQFKHYLAPFNITNRYKPQMVLITRYALGSIDQPERHQDITFGSLDKGYTESGFEINKLFFGFGLSFTYRYGAYHLPVMGDNVAFKFTFNVTL